MRILAGREYSSGSRWAVWRWTDADRLDGLPLLTNLHLLLTPWGALTLRWIHDADDRPDLHDHPCTFLSLRLRGRYWERTGMEDCWAPPRFRRIRAEHRHRIVYARRAVTLCLSAPSRREWGYWTRAGFVPWRGYDPS